MEISDEMVGPKGLIKTSELTKIIIQCLHSLDYKESADRLEKESGISWMTKEFRMLELNWDSCIEILENFNDVTDDTRTSALVAVFEHYLFECVCNCKLSLALDVLRKKVARSGIGEENVHKLAHDLIMRSKTVYLPRSRRRNLLSKLQDILLGIPQSRLVCIVESVVDRQIVDCLHHNASDISLYRDHDCLQDHIPSKTIQILTDHEGEVSLVQFSNSGKHLASSSDCTFIVWEVDNKVILKFKKKAHKKPISLLAWSPDDTKLLTFADMEYVYLWDIKKGSPAGRFGGENAFINYCAWFHDSKNLICVTNPKKLIFQSYCNSREAQKIRTLHGDLMLKVLDLAVTPDGKHVIVIFSDQNILILKVSKNSEGIINVVSERTISENHCITSLSISRDSQWLIVNVDRKEIHMWHVDPYHSEPLIFHGCDGRVIQSCFGGLDNMFIASGNEDSKVYIWNCLTENTIKVLSGHKKTVNCVSWNPERLQMLASASNDGTIRIWGPRRSNYKKVQSFIIVAGVKIDIDSFEELYFS